LIQVKAVVAGEGEDGAMDRRLPDTANWAFDADLLRRYDRPGPRYTSYPAAPQFTDSFGAADFAAIARESNVGAYSRPLSLYVHVPFCHSPCFYCGCNRRITRDPLAGATYLAQLQQEIALVAGLVNPLREVVQLHLGGGTPNFLNAAQLAELLDTLSRHFRFGDAASRDFSIELDPRHSTPGDIAALAAMGFNRASLGVQDFDPAVQAAINRLQSVEETAALLGACRAHGLRSVNIDLIYGLPLQTLEGFRRTLEQIVALRPDRLAVYGYAHMPHLFRAQRRIDPAQLPDAEGRLALLELAVRMLGAAGYVYIGMDHFALPRDALAIAQRAGGLHRNFMGYTTHAQTDLFGLGVSAISHVGDSFSQSHRDQDTWAACLARGELPVWRGRRMDEDDVIRADVIQRLMCHGEVNFGTVGREHGIVFRDYFAPSLHALAPLVHDGLVRVEADGLRVTPRGRGLLRVVAMRFDRYLQVPAGAPRYSRTI
jgi:oxygen-independent coproporphyrinogen-3 oxidase